MEEHGLKKDPRAMRMIRAIALLSICLPILSALFLTTLIFAHQNTVTLNIQTQDNGVAVIEALVELPAPPKVAFHVLTDYQNWPALFPEGVQVTVTPCQGPCVVTDLLIPHGFLPWETRLQATSHEQPPHTLETRLIEGDYLQYNQVWRLTPTSTGEHTYATLNLTLQPKGWIKQWTPDFLYRWMLRKEMEEHLNRLQRQVTLRMISADED